MDTEGLDSPHIPQWYNWTLSAIALLISTVFIYQTSGQIDSYAIERLSVILKVGEQLSSRTKVDKSSMPSFIWLIRDHQLHMKRAPVVEMEEKLNPVDLSAMKRCFAQYDCVPLPRPVDRDDMLPKVEGMEWGELKEEFRTEYIMMEKE